MIERGLYGITDAGLMPNDALLFAGVEAALRGGMRILQYRDKHLDDDAQLRQAQELKSLCHSYDSLFIVNDSIELAQRCAADGIHLGRTDSSLTQARAALGRKSIIGCSCYDQIELAITAQKAGADYVAFGRFFPSKTKPEATRANPRLIAEARTELSIPVCAIGGITTENATQLVDLGADLLAVINSLFGAPDIEGRAREFSAFFV